MILPEEYRSEGFRDIVLARRVNGQNVSNWFTRIKPNHALYMPLHYVLLFPYGEQEWYWSRRQVEPGDKKLKQPAFYRFRLHTRIDEPATLLRAQKVFQELVVDAWAICDQNKLDWIPSQQANI